MTREDVLREFDFDEAMADEIIRLRAQLTRMACPVCHEVNPAEVHTCTPAPKVTEMPRVFMAVTKRGTLGDVIRGGTLESAREITAGFDARYPDDAPHTVRRVALLDEPTTETA